MTQSKFDATAMELTGVTYVMKTMVDRNQDLKTKPLDQVYLLRLSAIQHFAHSRFVQICRYRLACYCSLPCTRLWGKQANKCASWCKRGFYVILLAFISTSTTTIWWQHNITAMPQVTLGHWLANFVNYFHLACWEAQLQVVPSVTPRVRPGC